MIVYSFVFVIYSYNRVVVVIIFFIYIKNYYLIYKIVYKIISGFSEYGASLKPLNNFANPTKIQKTGLSGLSGYLAIKMLCIRSMPTKVCHRAQTRCSENKITVNTPSILSLESVLSHESRRLTWTEPTNISWIFHYVHWYEILLLSIE